MTFSAAPFERILKKAGAKRVSKGAMEEFARIMEEKVYEVAKEAALLAKHAGRKTILGEDVIAAKKKFLS
ncbi:MAG: NFYB/HAP3 family transcription factor subunit [Candidatus Aenigmatarchaeota archaeon]